MRPEFVTFTGADDHTDVDRMLAMQADGGRIEWGILFSPKLQGEGRYPGFSFVDGLVGRGLRLSAHLCGGYAREAIASGRCEVLALYPPGTFSRIQVNTTATADTAAMARLATSAGASRAILQARGEFPGDTAVDWLHDASGGRGVIPPAWPAAPSGHALVGYAGGLGPDTIRGQSAAIAAAAGDVPYAIDMETGVRTDDRFDLDACQAVLDHLYGRV